MTNDLLIYGENICAFPHLLGSPSSYKTLHPIATEFPDIWGKFCFLFYQCGNGPIYLPQPKPTYLPNRGGIYFPQFFSIYPKQILVFTIYSIIPFNTYYPYKHSVRRRWNSKFIKKRKWNIKLFFLNKSKFRKPRKVNPFMPISLEHLIYHTPA